MEAFFFYRLDLPVDLIESRLRRNLKFFKELVSISHIHPTLYLTKDIVILQLRRFNLENIAEEVDLLKVRPDPVTFNMPWILNIK
jgi:hypothetical protein